MNETAPTHRTAEPEAGTPLDRPWRSAMWQPHLHHVMRRGRRLNYLDVGEGPAVVLLHGLASRWSVWFRNIPALAVDHRVIAVDLPGFGRSESLGGRPEIRDYVDAVAELLDRLNISRVRIVGHSMGAIIAQQFAARHHDRTAALVLVAAGGPPDRAQVLLLRGISAGSVVLNRQPWPIVRPALRAAMAAGPVRRLLLGLIIHDPDIVPRDLAVDMVSAVCRSSDRPALKAALRAVRQQDVPAIGCPTLIVGGDRDRLVPETSLDQVAAAIDGARREVMPMVGHHPMFERPEEFNAMLCGFLRETHDRFET